mgnify:CR=1 FL=1
MQEQLPRFTNAASPWSAGAARETIDKLLIQVGWNEYDPGRENLPSLCGITIRGRTAVWSFSIESDPVGSVPPKGSVIGSAAGLLVCDIEQSDVAVQDLSLVRLGNTPLTLGAA